MAVRCPYTITGGGSVTNIITNEIPIGDVDSHNTDFTIANTPVSGTLEVYLNGLIQAPGSAKDYTLSGTTISFTKAPRTNSEILVSYAK